MCSDIAISVKNLTKTYRIFGHPTDRIKQTLTLGRIPFYREFTALQNVSFEIKRGSAIGIVGRNGSGKSTLLQLICGILKPTSGEVMVNGRISALLELGSGFNPEFTGRENVYFQSAIMGIKKNEVDAKFDRIANFADIGEFIDQPVRTYSSGMCVRLAFAVAINVDPDILIVDEALAVGDEAFQRKCFAKLSELKDDGATLFLVSHSASVIATVCQRTLLLDSTRLVSDGSPASVLAQYQRLLHAPHLQTEVEGYPLISDKDISNQTSIDNSHETPQLIYPTSGAIIDQPRILNQNGEPTRVLHRGGRYTFQYRVQFQKSAQQIRYTMMFKTVAGFELGGLTSHLPGKAIDEVAEGKIDFARIEFTCRLLPGTYFLNAGVWGKIGAGDQFLHRIIDIYSFKVSEEGVSFQGGIVDFS